MTALSPSPQEALRRLERLADRLRVVGPRLAARDGAEAQETLAGVRAGLQHLADLAADADGRPRRAVPRLGAHALADQALVLGQDLLGHDVLGQDLHGYRGLEGSDEPARSDLFRRDAVRAIDALNDLV